MTTFILIAGWIICGVAGYVIDRRRCKLRRNSWTIRDRVFYGFQILLGLCNMISAILLYLGSLDKSKYWDKPAKW